MAALPLESARAAACHAADDAAGVISGFLARGDWHVTHKADASPVTEVDIACEQAIHTHLTEALPEAAFYGEETGHSPGEPGERGKKRQLVWLVDPIDGTKSFVRGMPYYSTQIALEADGELVLGVSHAPAFNERLVAVRGAGVTIDGEAVKSSGVTSVDEAFLSAGNLGSLARNPEAWQRYAVLVSRVVRTRGYGDFRHYHQLCCAQTDLIVESDLNILDIAALTVGVREAGGVITNLDGEPIDRNTRSVLAAATPALHAEALALLSGR